MTVRRLLGVVLGVVAALLACALGFFAVLLVSGALATMIDKSLNKTASGHEVAPPPLHDELFIVDLHADTMMWNRPFLERSAFGHVDLPRLAEGNVALQVFATVTKTVSGKDAPAGAVLTEGAEAVCLSPDEVNQTGWLQVAQLRPLRTWFDLRERAIYQAERLKTFIERANASAAADRAGTSPMILIESADDLARLVEARREDAAAGRPRTIGALIALEGAHWLGAQPTAEGVAQLAAAGFRMLAPTHRFNNALGASSEGCDQRAGLTEAGRAFVEDVDGSNIILDLAHASGSAKHEAAALVKHPVVISHTGLRSHCLALKARGENPCVIARTMDDEGVRDVARTGGIVGIGMWPEVGASTVEEGAEAFAAAHAILAAPEFVAERREVDPDYDPFDHLAFGSDFDGAVTTPIDIGGLPALTRALLDYRAPDGSKLFDEAAIRKIAGLNACRVFAERLPGGSPERARTICGTLAGGS